MFGVWWSGAEPDVIPAGEKGAGLQGADAAASGRQVRRSMPTSRSSSSRQGKSLAKPDEIGQVLYNRGLINSMLGTESIRTAHGQVRQQADDRRAGALGHRAPRPHGRAHQAARLRGHDRSRSRCRAPTTRARALSRVHQWDGKKWNVISDWYTADDAVIDAAGQGHGGQVRRREEDHRRATAPRRAERPDKRPRPAGRGASLSRTDDERRHARARSIRQRPRRRQHRGDLQSRHPGAEGRVARRCRRAASWRCWAPTAPASRRR